MFNVHDNSFQDIKIREGIYRFLISLQIKLLLAIS